MVSHASVTRVLLLVLAMSCAHGRSLQDTKKYSINLVNTFAKGQNNDIKQSLDVNLDEPPKLTGSTNPDNPNPVLLDPDNPRCDLDHPYAYPYFELTEEPILRTDGGLEKSSKGQSSEEESSSKSDDDRRRRLFQDSSDESREDSSDESREDSSDESREDSSDQDSSAETLSPTLSPTPRPEPELIPTVTREIFVGVDYQVKAVLVAKLTGREMKDSVVAIQGSGLDGSVDLDAETPKKTLCGSWIYNPSGRYRWSIGVTEDAQAEVYYYVKQAPGSEKETYSQMPVNLNYRHEYTVAGSENNVKSRSQVDTAARGGSISISLDNVVAGGDNVFEQSGEAGKRST